MAEMIAASVRLPGIHGTRSAGAVQRLRRKATRRSAYNADREGESGRSDRSAITRTPSSLGQAQMAVESFYEAVNQRRLDEALTKLADNIVYEDLTFPEAFEGKEAMKKFLVEICQGFPQELQFVIDRAVTDGTSVGLTWHVEIDGNELPFSRGCSFYQTDENGLIVYARDVVEPSIKPGHAALQTIKVVAPLLKYMANSKDTSIEGGQARLEPLSKDKGLQFFLASGIVLYVGHLLLSTSAPGNPIWSTTAETWTSVLNKSLNFFYVNPLMNAVGIHLFPTCPEHPCDEALFNLVNAWSLMFLGLYASDTRRPVEINIFGLWVGQMFLTNLALMPYMVLRLNSTTKELGNMISRNMRESSPLWKSIEEKSCVIGNIGLAIGGLSVLWFFIARPDIGGSIQDRIDFFHTLITTDRISYAFLWDCVLYSIFQAWLIDSSLHELMVSGKQTPLPSTVYKLPFIGMALWLRDRELIREKSKLTRKIHPVM